jgi:hypothetical protein
VSRPSVSSVAAKCEKSFLAQDLSVSIACADFPTLDIHVITVSTLRRDQLEHRQALHAAVGPPQVRHEPSISSILVSLVQPLIVELEIANAVVWRELVRPGLQTANSSTRLPSAFS